MRWLRSWVLLAFSYKRRHFCLSCHQKRVVEFGEWLCGELLKTFPHILGLLNGSKIWRGDFLLTYNTLPHTIIFFKGNSFQINKKLNQSKCVTEAICHHPCGKSIDIKYPHGFVLFLPGRVQMNKVAIRIDDFYIGIEDIICLFIW